MCNANDQDYSLKLHKIESVIVPYDISIPPIPIHFKCKTQLLPYKMKLYGLPDGLYFDETSETINGRPRSYGRHGVVVVVSNEHTHDCVGFVLDVIELKPIRSKIKKIEDQHISLGQSLKGINIELDEPDYDINVTVDGLPYGVVYDSFRSQIVGFPEIPCESLIYVRTVNQYGTEITDKFLLTVEGVIEPSLTLEVISQEKLVDSEHGFHQQDDQIIYSFMVCNIGNVPLTKISVEDPNLGVFQSQTKVYPKSQLTIKCVYHITQQDLEKSNVTTNIVASGETYGGIRLMTQPITNMVKIRGHDRDLGIQMICVDSKVKSGMIDYLVLVRNDSHQLITNLKGSDLRGNHIVFNDTHVNVNGYLFGYLQRRCGSGFNVSIMCQGVISNDQEIVNMFDYVILSELKEYVDVELYSTQMSIGIGTPVTLVVCVKSKRNESKTKSKPKLDNYNHVTGIVEFYDGLQLLGKSQLDDGQSSIKLSDLSLGNHDMYVLYQGNRVYHPNGSKILIQSVVDKKIPLPVTQSHTEHQMIEAKAHNLLKSKLRK
jgi:hypothetical protein